MGKTSGSMSYLASQKLDPPRKDTWRGDVQKPQNPPTVDPQATGPERESLAGDSQRVLERDAPIPTIGIPKATFHIVQSGRSALRRIRKGDYCGSQRPSYSFFA